VSTLQADSLSSADKLPAPTGTWPALALASAAALLASGCCVLPLVLALGGISGAWVSQLRWLRPYSDALVVLALASLALAAWRIYRLQAAPQDCQSQACLRVNTAARRWFWLVALLTLTPVLVPALAPLFY
jgi:mercuric ion transport protein